MPRRARVWLETVIEDNIPTTHLPSRFKLVRHCMFFNAAAIWVAPLSQIWITELFAQPKAVKM